MESSLPLALVWGFHEALCWALGSLECFGSWMTFKKFLKLFIMKNCKHI